MENVLDQTSVYAPQGIKDVSVMKVDIMHEIIVSLMFLISYALPALSCVV